MRFFGFACVAILAATSNGGAQSTADQTAGIRRQRIERALERLNPGTEVRVRSSSGITAGLLLKGEGVARLDPPVNGDTIEEMWKRSGSAGHGALIGAGVGAVTVAGFGVLLASALCDVQGGCLSERARVSVYGFVIGGAGGAVLGAGIGSLVRRWVRIYPEPN